MGEVRNTAKKRREADRDRTVMLRTTASRRENDLVRERMALVGTKSIASFLRKLAVDGFIIRPELAGAGEMIALLQSISDGVKEIASRPDGAERPDRALFEEIRKNQETLIGQMNRIIGQFTGLVVE